MSQDSIVVLNIGLIILALIGLLAWFLTLRFRRRELQHREWMAAIEKGMPLPELKGLETGMDGPRTYLLRGLVWLACGLTLMLFLSVWVQTTRGFPFGLAIIGIVPAGVGAAYILFYVLETNRSQGGK